MYKAEFDKLLQNGSLPKNFIFFGEGIFFIDYYTSLLSQIEDANILKLYFDEYDFSTAKAHLSQGSLFGGVNLLVIKSEKKVPKKELETLFELSNKGENRMIYAYYGSDHRSYNNAFKKLQVATVRFFHPKQNEALFLLQQEAKKEHLNIDNYTLSHLLKIQNNNLLLALSELKKLAIYANEQITTKEIDTLVYGNAEVDLHQFIKNFLNKQEYLHDLEQLLEQGEDEIYLLTSLTNQIQELFMFNAYIRTYGTANAKEILGYNPPAFVVQEKASMAMRIKPESFYNILKRLLEVELEMKSAQGDKKALLFSVLMEIFKRL